MASKVDIEVYGSLGMFTVLGASRKGIKFLVNKVHYEPWQGLPEDGIVVEGTEYANAIALGAVKSGLRVEVNGQTYQNRAEE